LIAEKKVPIDKRSQQRKAKPQFSDKRRRAVANARGKKRREKEEKKKKKSKPALKRY